MDARTLSLLWNTLLLSGATCALSVPIGTLLAWLLWRTDLAGRRFFLGLMGVMIFVPLYLQAGAWQAGFGDQGWFTLATNSSAWLTGWRAAIWIHCLAALPWVVGIVGIGLRLVEPELEEQALLDGSASQVFFRVSLRGAMPAVGMAAIWVAVITAGEMTVTDLFSIRTYAEEVYTQAAATASELDAAPPSVLLGIVITTLLIIGGFGLCYGLSPSRRPLSLRRYWTFRLGRWKFIYLLAAGLFFLLISGVPLGSLVYKAGVVVAQTDAGRIRSFSTAKCLAVICSAPEKFHRELGWSLLIGVLSATAAVLTAIPLAWMARKKDSRSATDGRGFMNGATNARDIPQSATNGRGFTFNLKFAIYNLQFAIIVLVIAVLLTVPGPILGIAVIRLLNRPELPGLVWLYDQSILAPWLAVYLRSLPIVALIMWQALQTVPAEILESAMIDGAGPVVRLWRIALPMRWPAAAVAWLAALAISLGDLAASILVVPPGVTTLSIRIFGLLHYGVEDQAAGICLAMIAIFALLAWGVFRLAPRISRAK
ncbi:MAG: ABC transporter permease subunit [Thermoguttaceae bacterium]